MFVIYKQTLFFCNTLVFLYIAPQNSLSFVFLFFQWPRLHQIALCLLIPTVFCLFLTSLSLHIRQNTTRLLILILIYFPLTTTLGPIVVMATMLYTGLER